MVMIDQQELTPSRISTHRSRSFAPRCAAELGCKIGAILLLLILLILAVALLLSEEQQATAVPSLLILSSFLLFCVVLAARVRSGIFGEVGFIFAGFAVAYSIIPAINFLILNFNFSRDFDSLNFAVLNPQPGEIGEHLWRHCIFTITVMVAYVVARGRDVVSRPASLPLHVDAWIVAVVAMVVAICVGAVTLLSAPVEDYYGHYTRFDALSWGAKRFAFLCLILKTGGYYVVLSLMFSDYRRYKFLVILFVLSVAVYELSYSLGSRIETLSVLLAAVCLFHFDVAKIRLRQGLIYLVFLLFLFTAVEFYRSAEFDISTTFRDFYGKGLRFATEFGAVYYTSFHLYVERLRSALPHQDWLMLFNDFFTIVPFYEHTEFNSQYWYARNYFPDAIVPPQTMGPIADSAIWGGELDLVVRGALTGFGYGWLAKWARKRWNDLLVKSFYAFLYASCVIGLKYSLVYQISQIVRTLFPALLFVYLAFWLKKYLIGALSRNEHPGSALQR